MKCALQNFCRASDSRSPKVRLNCGIHSVKKQLLCGQVFWRDYLPFSIGTFARERSASRFLKSGAHSSRQKEERNDTSVFCSGEMQRPRRIGDHKQIAVSICSIFEARST